jgi:hypothetical protein
LQQKNGLETETNSEQITSKINSEEHAAIDELPKNIESTKNIFHKPELSKPLDEIGDANKEINTSSANIENGIAERTADEDQLIKETGVVDIGNTPNGNCHGQSKDICAFGETENKGTEPAVGENLPQFSGSNRSLSEPTTTDSSKFSCNLLEMTFSVFYKLRRAHR